MAPTSPGWRDVLELQRQTLKAVESVRTENNAAHADFDRRLRSLENASLLSAGERKGERKVLGVARSTLALIVSVLSGLVAASTALGHRTP